MIQLTLAGVDTLAASAALMIACFVTGGSFQQAVAELPSILLLSLLWPFIYWREELYPGYGTPRHVKLKKYVVGAVLAGLLLVGLKPFLYNEIRFTYPMIIVGALLSAIAAYGIRIGTQRLLYSIGVWGKHVLVLGAGETGAQIVRSLQSHPLSGLHPVAVFDDDPEKYGRRVEGLDVRGSLADASAYAAWRGIDHAILAIPTISPKNLSVLATSEPHVFKHLQFVPDLPGLPTHSVRSGSLEDRLVIEVRNNLRRRRNQMAKRAFDLVAGTLGSIAILPVIGLVAIAIRIDSRGPIFYAQERRGRGGRRFHIWKFRSMVHDADARLKAHLEEHPELRDEWEATQKLTCDPRVTRVGRFLRSTSLDELPQLFNVLRGDMSLVGPRPIVDDEIARYGDDWEHYQLVRPGITGYWQVSGRSDASYEFRVGCDRYYTRNWSIWLDLVLLVSTVRVVFSREGAY